jgi:hypothetical protein
MLNLVLLFVLVAGLISCGGQPVPATSFQSPSEPTVVSTVSGEVVVMKAGTSTWSQLSSGTALEVGDRIRTGPGSNAVITFFEGSTIELAADTEVDVSELGVAGMTGSTSIKLRQQVGKTTSRVKKLVDPASRYEIETPDGAAVVRGSVGDVLVTEGNSTTIMNRQGQWSAIFNGVEIPIPQAYQITFSRGQLTIPVPMPIPPAPVPPPPPVPSEASYPSRHQSAPTPVLIPGISLTKTADKTQACVNEIITYTYKVANSGNTPLSSIVLTDDKAGTPTYQSGDVNGDNKLDVNETWVFTASYTVSSKSQRSFTLVNTATVSGRDALSHLVAAQASASVYILRPAIALTKAANKTQACVNNNITYTYHVTNPGGVPLSNIVLTDDKAGTPTYQSGDVNGDNKLDVNETWVFTASYTVLSQSQTSFTLVNTATVSGMDALSQVVTAQYSANVEVLIPCPRP